MSKTELQVIIVSMILLVSIQGCGRMENSNFESMRLTKSATITLNGTIADVLPLFGAREEQKWADHWNPEFIYPRDKPDEKNNVFKVEHKGHGIHASMVTYWIMTEYSRELNKISYAIFSDHDLTTINIQCEAVSDSTTTALIEYNWTSLDDDGNNLIEKKAEHIFSKNLVDWEEAINQYLSESTSSE